MTGWVDIYHPLAAELKLSVSASVRYAATSDTTDVWFRASSNWSPRPLARSLLFVRRSMPALHWVQAEPEEILEPLLDDAMLDFARQLYTPVSLYEHLSVTPELTLEAIDEGAINGQLSPLETERLLAKYAVVYECRDTSY